MSIKGETESKSSKFSDEAIWVDDEESIKALKNYWNSSTKKTKASYTSGVFLKEYFPYMMKIIISSFNL